MKPFLSSCLSYGLFFPVMLLAQSQKVHIRTAESQGSRVVEQHTENAVIENYLHSWKTLQQALDTNQVSALDPEFVGVVRNKLADTIDSQSRLGIHSRYQDLSHDLQIVFYSPEGLSIQLIDDVEYRQEVLEKDKLLASVVVRRRYLVMLTPSETRWQIRIMQAISD